MVPLVWPETHCGWAGKGVYPHLSSDLLIPDAYHALAGFCLSHKNTQYLRAHLSTPLLKHCTCLITSSCLQELARQCSVLLPATVPVSYLLLLQRLRPPPPHALECRNLLLEARCLSFNIPEERAALLSLLAWRLAGDCHWQLGDRGVLAACGGSAQVHVNVAFSLSRRGRVANSLAEQHPPCCKQRRSLGASHDPQLPVPGRNGPCLILGHSQVL